MAELKKDLGLLDVFCLAAGAMISSGLFILPGLAYASAGPSVVLAYLFASILMVPSLFCYLELATAMPRAGGAYFYIDRSFGSILGFFSGIASWFALALKSAFAIVGVAALVEIILLQNFGFQMQPWHLKSISVLCCVIFGVLNTVSVKHTSRFQVVLVVGLLAILGIYLAFGFPAVRVIRFDGFMQKGLVAFLGTTGLVFISFGGLNKATNIAEEVKNPERNMVLGMFLAWFIVSLLYVLVVFVTVGVLEGEDLSGTLVPVGLAAQNFMGTFGFVLMGLGAAAAFITTANGGILAASRCPMAMSRDKLLPQRLSRINKKFGTPHISIILTCAFMIIALVLLDIEDLVKTASTLLIMLYILSNAAVIVMRESNIQSYRPKFFSPLYPWLQILSIILFGILIIDMGLIPILVCIGVILASAFWYFVYISSRVRRASAVMHIVERVTDKELHAVTLEAELRDILLVRDNVTEDRFDKLIRECDILDYDRPMDSHSVFEEIADRFAGRIGADRAALYEKFLRRESESATVIQPGMAIPHVVCEGSDKFGIMLIRAKEGISFPGTPEPVRIMFALVGSKDQRNFHLRALMAIAQVAQEKEFEQQWLSARGPEGLRNLVLLSGRKRDIPQQ